MKKFLKYILFFLIGSIIFDTNSLIQKLFILKSYDLPNNIESYLVPTIIGGILGLIYGYQRIEIIELNKNLRYRVNNLEKILPICSICKKVCTNPEASDEERVWVDITNYALPQKFTHGYCPECFKEVMKKIEE